MCCKVQEETAQSPKLRATLTIQVSMVPQTPHPGDGKSDFAEAAVRLGASLCTFRVGTASEMAELCTQESPEKTITRPLYARLGSSDVSSTSCAPEYLDRGPGRALLKACSEACRLSFATRPSCLIEFRKLFVDHMDS